MSKLPLLLGIDIGTTGAKAILLDSAGTVLAEATNEYPMATPRPLWAEQDPQDWWAATVASIRDVLRQAPVRDRAVGAANARTAADLRGLGEAVAGIGLTGQMHGLVLLDGRGQVLRPCIMWNDQRTAAQCVAITQRLGAQRMLELTGNPVLPGFTAPKLVWVRENEPDVYARIRHVLLPKDYIRYRLTGEFFSEVSDASGTAMFDVGRRRWSEEVLAALDVPRTWLPEVTESPVASAAVSAAAAAETGLKPGTLVVGGGGDQAAQAVGTGSVSEGIVSVTIGTSGVVFATRNAYCPEPQGRLHAFCHATPGVWHLMGVMLAAGGGFRWFRDALGQTEQAQAAATGVDVYELLTAEAAQAPAGCEGLLFLPYLCGERTPYADPHARGAFVGLTLRHTKAHLTRAVMEGVTFGLRDSLELMRELGLEIRQVRATGGGARSRLWRQMLADVFNTEIVTVNVTQGAAFGAALLAGVGVGVYPDVAAACQTVVNVMERCTPGPATRVYADYYPRYRALYPLLADEFAAISEMVGNHTEPRCRTAPEQS